MARSQKEKTKNGIGSGRNCFLLGYVSYYLTLYKIFKVYMLSVIHKINVDEERG